MLVIIRLHKETEFLSIRDAKTAAFFELPFQKVRLFE
jgi:hypothetical protein